MNKKIIQGLMALSISLGAVHAAVDSGSNLGGGDGVFKDVNGTTMEFNTLVAGTNIGLTTGTNTVTINTASTDTSLTTSFTGFDLTSITYTLNNIDKQVVMHVPGFSGTTFDSISGLVSIDAIPSGLRPTQTVSELMPMDIDEGRYINFATVDTSGVVTIWLSILPFDWDAGRVINSLPFSMCWHT